LLSDFIFIFLDQIVAASLPSLLSVMDVKELSNISETDIKIWRTPAGQLYVVSDHSHLSVAQDKNR
jgi:hypothetical protein